MIKKRFLESLSAPAGEKSRLRQNVESIALALIIALAVRTSVVQAFWVPSGSMLPTIQIGDHLFVNKLAYAVQLPFVGSVAKVGDVERGDIVVFVSPVDHQTDLIKRVVAVAGDRIELRKKRLYINDEPVADPYAHFDDVSVNAVGPRDNFDPVVVPEGKFFVLGDNRDRSYDSRFWGFADVADIKGKATFIYWSWDKESHWPRLARMGHFLR